MPSGRTSTAVRSGKSRPAGMVTVAVNVESTPTALEVGTAIFEAIVPGTVTVSAAVAL